MFLGLLLYESVCRAVFPWFTSGYSAYAMSLASREWFGDSLSFAYLGDQPTMLAQSSYLYCWLLAFPLLGEAGAPLWSLF